ncbi:hypothetical protein K1F50_17185 [Muricauda oceani]|uniref:Uncharacterized protein n=1 Tax=Flagellimonas oceani TaxID=2698672 RepID=A0A6G7J4U5_9FLAO|nr:hypothetical protein [Allomuricauda oceani]MBW8244545.1 hypothetical protein [Allomuricauda oceani]QII45806.1 hypothetical protein GVT53_14355 [Allomuricauda oceani]
MNYKTKSLIYFSCFLAASTLYYVVDQRDDFQNQLNSKTYVETHFEDTGDFTDESTKDDLEEKSK